MKKEIVLLLMAGTAVAVAPGALAQSNAAQRTSAAEVNDNAIIVTATRREQTLQEVPVAVSVVSGDLLDSTGVNGVSQITEAAPSITFTRGSNETNSSLNIRGIGTNVFSNAVEPSVSVVFDDVVLARAAQSFQDFIDVQRVEVLRGPQSTLFGKNASAGVVSVTTKDPSPDLSGKFDAMYAAGGEYQTRGTLSGPISDTLGIRMSGFFRHYDGASKNVYNDTDANGEESWGFRGKLQWEPTSQLTVKLIGDYRRSKASPAYVYLVADDPRVAALISPVVPSMSNTDINVNIQPFSRSTQGGVQLNADYHFDSDFVLSSVSAYRRWNFFNEVDVDGTPLAVGDPSQGITFAWDSNSQDAHLDQYSQEIRLASPDLGGFDFLVGLFAYKLEIDQYFQRRWVYSGSVGRSGSFNSTTSTTNLAAFTSANIYLGDVTIFGGARILNEKLTWGVHRDPADVIAPADTPLPGAAGQPANFSGSTSDTTVTGNIGVRYDFGIGNIYASYARGYKGKGINVAFASLDGSEPVDPENSNAFEAGLKLATDDRKFELNMAAFYTKYSNYQAQAQRTNDITFELRNAGSISTRGFEIESVMRPGRNLQVRLNATIMKAKIDSFPGGPCWNGQTAAQGCVSSAQDLSGADLPNAPDVRLTGFIKQIIPLGGSSPVDAFVQGNFTYQSDVQWRLDQDPRTVQDGYGKLNLAAGIQSKDDRYSLMVFVRNVTNEHAPASIDNLGMLNGGGLIGYLARDHERYWGVQGMFSF